MRRLSWGLCVLVGCGPRPPGSSETQATGPGTDDNGSTAVSTDVAETTTTTDEGDPETTGPGSTFVPDLNPLPESCNVFTQDCPDGEKCVPYSSNGGIWDAHKCVPVRGDQAVGEPCTYDGVIEATDDCDATSLCWDVMDVDGEPIGTCMPLCSGTEDDPECPPNWACLISSFAVGVCVSTCDPTLQDCDEGAACYWANSDFKCMFTTQDIPIGEPCGFINDCTRGSSCATADNLPDCAGSACCAPFCSLLSGDLPCEALPGTGCVPFFEQGTAPPGYEDVGICLLP